MLPAGFSPGLMSFARPGGSLAAIFAISSPPPFLPPCGAVPGACPFFAAFSSSSTLSVMKTNTIIRPLIRMARIVPTGVFR